MKGNFLKYVLKRPHVIYSILSEPKIKYGMHYLSSDIHNILVVLTSYSRCRCRCRCTCRWHSGNSVFFVCFFLTHSNTSSPLYPPLNPASCTSFLLQVPLLDGHLSPRTPTSATLWQPGLRIHISGSAAKQMKRVKVLSFFSWSAFFIIMFFFHCLFISFLCQCLHHLVQRTEKKAKYQKLSKTQTEMEKKGTAKWGPASYPETTTHAAPMWFTHLVTLDTEKQSVICYHTVATCCYSRLFDNNKSEDD